MAPTDKKDKTKRMICLCNSVTQQTIEEAIARGCNSLGKIFDATTGGAGACGGSCQPTIRKMLETFAESGQFPENPRHPDPVRRKRGY